MLYNPSVAGFVPRAQYEALWDFENVLTGTPFGASNNGTGATVSAGTATAAHPGTAQTSTGTTTTGRGAASTGVAIILLGGGSWIWEADINIAALDDGTDTYTLRLGFLDILTADVVDGVYFEYDKSVSANWRICTANNSTRTKTNTSTAVAAATWIRLRFEINAAGTSAEFFIDGVSVGTIATNIPTAAGRETGMGWALQKTAGTNARTFDLDYWYVKNIFTTQR